MTRTVLALVAFTSLAACGGSPAPRRYVVELAVSDPQSDTVLWYEHVTGHGIGAFAGDEEVHVVMCNERVTPPCVRLEIDDVDAAGRRAVLERLQAARCETCDAALAPAVRGSPPPSGTDWSHQ